MVDDRARPCSGQYPLPTLAAVAYAGKKGRVCRDMEASEGVEGPEAKPMRIIAAVIKDQSLPIESQCR